jgi:4-methyl-5(b-hydroxyethyl)-thiazole monophosphate biosynthesis
MAKVLIPLAQGCEELEAVTLINILRRAKISVVTAGLDDHPVEGSRGTILLPDTTLDAASGEAFDMILLPGGATGTDNLCKDARIGGLLKKAAEAGKFIGAICAAPRVLAQAGLLNGKTATAYPGMLNPADYPEVTVTDAAIEDAGLIMTSRGPGTAMDFALAIVEKLTNAETRKSVEEALVRG